MKSTFKEVRFVMNKRQPIFPRSLFEGESSIFINRPMDEMSWPTSRNGKVICCTMPFKMSNLHYNWWEFGQLLKAIINSPLEDPLLDMDKFIRFCRVKIQTKSNMKLQ